MTRITKAMTDKIVNNALAKAGITAGEEALKKDRQEWLERVRISVIGGDAAAVEMEKNLAKIRELRGKLPKDFDAGHSVTYRYNEVRVNVAGMRVAERFEKTRDCPWSLTITADNPLTDKFHALETRRMDLSKRKDEVKANVRAAVSRFTTVAKLLTEWPEAAELLPKTGATPKTNLPTVKTADLNKLIGLPSE